MTLEELEKKIVIWGQDKGILPHPDPMAQWEKTLEEVIELKDAIEANDREAAKDAIGDVFVTLVMGCGYWSLTMEQCVEQAYNVISKRTGKMVDGQFVKDAD